MAIFNSYVSLPEGIHCGATTNASNNKQPEISPSSRWPVPLDWSWLTPPARCERAPWAGDSAGIKSGGLHGDKIPQIAMENHHFTGWWFFALPLWKMWWKSSGIIDPNIWKKTCSKPPTSLSSVNEHKSTISAMFTSYVRNYQRDPWWNLMHQPKELHSTRGI